jgi:hypothetical protein
MNGTFTHSRRWREGLFLAKGDAVLPGYDVVWKGCVKLEYKARFATQSCLIEQPVGQQITRSLHLESLFIPTCHVANR